MAKSRQIDRSIDPELAYLARRIGRAFASIGSEIFWGIGVGICGEEARRVGIYSGKEEESREATAPRSSSPPRSSGGKSQTGRRRGDIEEDAVCCRVWWPLNAGSRR